MKSLWKSLLILVLVMGLAYVAWLRFSPQPAPVGSIVPAKVALAAKAIPKVIRHPKAVKTYASAAKRTLQLPKLIADDKNMQVLASSSVDPDSHPHTITTLLNIETGDITTVDRREALPWLTIRRSGALGLEHDLFRQINTVYVRQDLIQSKDLVLGGKLGYSSERKASASVLIEWRW